MEAESVVKLQSTNFLWSSAHDVLFSREILASEPYRYKLRSPERGRAWEQIAQNLNSIKEPKFRVTPRSVRDRYTLLTTKKVNQLKHEERASGIAVIQTELDILLEEILEKEKEAKVQLELGIGEKKKQVEKEKISAEDMRQQAMERMSQTSKRKGENEDSSTVKKKKNRKSSNELFVYFEEKLSKGYAFKQEKLAKQMKEQEAIDKRERERNERQDKAAQQQNDIMVAMMNQQQQQQQQLQNLQAMFLNQQQQQTQALLAILEKTVKK